MSYFLLIFSTCFSRYECLISKWFFTKAKRKAGKKWKVKKMIPQEIESVDLNVKRFIESWE